MKPFFVTVPHAGERVPDEAFWLKGLPEPVLMCDVDRYVNALYKPAVDTFGVPHIMADIHRYVVDLNRVPEDIDQDSVEESSNPPGKFTIGYHWTQTTTAARLMRDPISQKLHKELTQKYFEPFHADVKAMFAKYKKTGASKVYHLDAHSMPSKGTAAHRDPGTSRPEIVVSDRDGVSCEPAFKDLVISSFDKVGFQVSYNWPYKGGRITETYGQPALGQHTLQVEMNRSLYMDEITKKKLDDKFSETQKRITQAMGYIVEGLKHE
jgi:N-formylglutamate deformylase